MSAWIPTEWERRLGKYVLQVWQIASPKGEFWVLAVRHFKTREIPIPNYEVFSNPKAARIKAMKIYKKLKKGGKT